MLNRKVRKVQDDNEKNAQKRRKHCALVVVMRTHKQTNKQTRTGAITIHYTAASLARSVIKFLKSSNFSTYALWQNVAHTQKGRSATVERRERRTIRAVDETERIRLVGPRSRLTDVQLVSKAVKMCMGMGFPMGPGISWESHWNGNKTSELGMGMGMGGNGKPPQWEWELPALPWEFIPKGFIL